MGSVADDLRRQLRARTRVLSPDERVALTGTLAEADVDFFCAARGVDRDAARRAFRRRRQAGRRFSAVMREPEP